MVCHKQWHASLSKSKTRRREIIQMNTKQKFKRFAIALIAFALCAVEGHAQKDRVFDGIEDLLSLIADSEAARPNGEWKIATVSEASKQLNSSQGRQIHFTVKVEKLLKNIIHAPAIHRAGGGHPYDVKVVIFLPSDEPTLTAEVAQGQTVDITGKLRFAALSYVGPTTMQVSINFDSATVEKPSGILASKTPNTTTPTNSTNTRVNHPEGIALDPRWDSALPGDSLTLQDLGAILSKEVKRGRDIAPHPDLKIYGEVTYLMPLERAKEVLGLSKRVNSKNKMASSGFPASSLYHYGFTGQYEGIYNQLYIITDRADQVVSIQLVAEHPHGDIPKVQYGDWHVYNFVNARHKALSTLQIGYSAHNKSDILVIDSVLRDSGLHTSRSKSVTGRANQTTSHSGLCLESVRWYLPTPLAGLILECIGKQTPGGK